MQATLSGKFILRISESPDRPGCRAASVWAVSTRPPREAGRRPGDGCGAAPRAGRPPRHARYRRGVQRLPVNGVCGGGGVS